MNLYKSGGRLESFWVILGSFLVHDGGFGSLWGHFGISLESLLTDAGA